jgi:hypothetical protein
MEFDIKQLDYLEFKFIEVARSTKVSTWIYYQDLKRSNNLVLIVYDKTEQEKVIYKFYKTLDSKQITEKLLYRDAVNGFPFLVFQRQGPSLAQIFQYQSANFSNESIMLIGYKMVG